MWQQDFEEFMRGSIEGLAKAAAGLIEQAFSVGALTPEWWVTVVGGEVTTTVAGGASSTIQHPGMLNVVVIAMIPLLMIFVAVQVLLSGVRGSTAGMLRAFVGAVFAVPATYAVVGLVWMAMGATQELTLWILRVGAGETDGEDAAVAGVLALFGLTWDPAGDKILLDENYAQWEMASDQGTNGMILVAWIVALVIFLACFILMAMMIFRVVLILILASFAAPAIFSLTLEPAKALAGRWLSMTVGLMLAAPVAAVVVRMGMAMASLSTDWVQTVAGMVLVFVAAAMPMLMLAVTSWLGGGAGQAEQAGVMAASRAGRGAMNSMRGASARAGRMRQRAGSLVTRGGR